MRNHQLMGDIRFQDMAIELEPGVWAGSFDGWFAVDSAGAVSTIYLTVTANGALDYLEYDMMFAGDFWLAVKLRQAIEFVFAGDIDDVLTERNPRPAERDPGPSQVQRL